MKPNPAIAISVLAALLMGLACVMVYLVSSEFAAEKRLSDVRVSLGAIRHQYQLAALDLSNRLTELADARKQLQTATGDRTAAQTDQGQQAESLRTQLATRDAEIAAIRKRLDSATNELNHVLTQFRSVETELQQKLNAALAKAPPTDGGIKSTTALAQQLQAERHRAEEATARATTLQKSLDAAIQELALLRTKPAQSPNQVSSTVPGTAVEKVVRPAPATPAPNAQPLPAAGGAFGVVLNVDSDFGFITASLNPTQGLPTGATLKVTRAGLSVGMLKVSRIQREGLVFADILQVAAGQSIAVGDRVDLQR